MMPSRRRAGQSMIEFALVAPILFLLLIGTIDLLRMSQARTTVSDAARQGARQAAAFTVTGDGPFSTADANPCSGSSPTSSATGQGCLTDARIKDTVGRVMSGLVSQVNLLPSTGPAACTTPPSGQVNVCISPGESGSAGTDLDCAAARTRLGHDPRPGDLGTRKEEWTNATYQGCYMVQVTVVYGYQPLIDFVRPFLAGVTSLSSSTAIVSEY